MKNERECGIRTPFPDNINCLRSFTRKRDMSTRLNKLAREDRKNGDIRCQVFSTASDDLYIGKSHNGTVIMALDIG